MVMGSNENHHNQIPIEKWKKKHKKRSRKIIKNFPIMWVLVIFPFNIGSTNNLILAAASSVEHR